MNKKIKVTLSRNRTGALTARPDYTIANMTNALNLLVPDTNGGEKLAYVGDRISEEQAQSIVGRPDVEVAVTAAK